MSEILGLSPDLGQRIVTMLREWEASTGRGGAFAPSRKNTGILIRRAKVTVKLSAGTEAQASSDGRAILHEMTDTGAFRASLGQPSAVQIWNGYTSEVATGTLIWVFLYGGRWIALTENCA